MKRVMTEITVYEYRELGSMDKQVADALVGENIDGFYYYENGEVFGEKVE